MDRFDRRGDLPRRVPIVPGLNLNRSSANSGTSSARYARMSASPRESVVPRSSRKVPQSARAAQSGISKSTARIVPRAAPHSGSHAGPTAASELKQLQDLLRMSSLTTTEEMANQPAAVDEGGEDNTSKKVAQVMSGLRHSVIDNVGKFRRVTKAKSCAICLVEFSHGQHVVHLPCATSHVFHDSCFRSWVRKGQRGCPLCRSDIRHSTNKISAPTCASARRIRSAVSATTPRFRRG